MKIRHVIIAVTKRNQNILRLLATEKLVSMSFKQGRYVIIARYGTNKATLMRMLNKAIEN